MDQKEIEQFSEQLKSLSESLSGLNATTDKASASFSNELGKKFPNAAQPTMAALKGLGNAVTDVTAALYRGERGMKVMANGIDKLVDGVQAAAAIFTMFTPWGKALSIGSKLLINGVALAAKGVSSLNKLNAEQSDRLYKVYQDLSNVGAAGAGGLEKLFDTMQRAGFTAAELDQFAAVIKRNSQDLSMFGATTADGAKALAQMSGGILKGNLGMALMNLGYNAESLASSTATYLSLQNRLGNIQLKTATQLQTEAGAYAVELDKLTRLTGLSREEQEKRQRSLISDERYAGFMATGARTQGYDVANLEKFFGLIKDEGTRKGLQHLLAGGGAATSEEARRIMQTDPMAYQRMMQVARGGSAAEAAVGFYGQAGQYMRGVGGQVGRYTGAGPGISLSGNLEESERFAQMAAGAKKAGMTLEQYVEAEQKRIAADKGALAEQNKLRLEQLGAAQALDKTVNSMGFLQNATNAAAESLNKLTTKLGGKPAGGAPVGSKGATTAPSGGPGAVPGAIPASGSLSGKSLEGLDPAFASKVQAAADEYMRATGKPLDIVSAKRSAEKQKELYDAAQSGRSRFPAAKPGTSLHELGKAIDLSPEAANFLDSSGILARNGLKRPHANDPIHITGAAGFNGMLSGPMSGYRPNILMHGTEELSIRPMGRTSNDTGIGGDMDASELVSRLSELVSIGQKQLQATQKMLRYQT